MKLPASLLSHLRVSIAAGAVVATGCDLAAAEDAPKAAEAPAESIQASPVEAAESAPEPSRAEPDGAGIAAVARAAAEERARPRVAEAIAVDEDPTAVVPFSSEATGPSRVKPREEAPLAFAAPPPPRPKPRVKRPKPAPKPVIGKGWDDCPACGRG